ncbi:hypothetical protein COV93_04515 [Candidatus Woesearchaeota archaeon CG11_big_fil_rev_8_21_14_0_20_43_8]|nr:MAG: hypothetical protein COV93_04515 [Candidatus Woesearchaeota archaeon CG11_big_fil_rev_8_21_14_0_20_43_8]PIO05385.1 MAG: hypothetical protein COT47_05040 [Candidatus Woesearchaeota archaeon CG08_land_8_20_14_0_20_43_7]
MDKYKIIAKAGLFGLMLSSSAGFYHGINAVDIANRDPAFHEVSEMQGKLSKLERKIRNCKTNNRCHALIDEIDYYNTESDEIKNSEEYINAKEKIYSHLTYEMALLPLMLGSGFLWLNYRKKNKE